MSLRCAIFWFAVLAVWSCTQPALPSGPNTVNGSYAFVPKSAVGVEEGADAGQAPVAVSVGVADTTPTGQCPNAPFGSGSQIFQFLLFNDAAGISLGTYAITGGPAGRATEAMLLADAGVATLANFDGGTVTLTTLEPNRIVGSFSVSGEATTGGTAHAEGTFDTSTICNF